MIFPRTRINFDEVLDFLVSEPSPEAIIAYRAPDALQTHLDELLELNRQRSLTPDEQNDLEELLRFDDFVAALKIRAHRRLAES